MSGEFTDRHTEYGRPQGRQVILQREGEADVRGYLAVAIQDEHGKPTIYGFTSEDWSERFPIRVSAVEAGDFTIIELDEPFEE